MPRCYLLAVSKGSSLDGGTNNYSLFSLSTRVRFEIPEPPAGKPPSGTAPIVLPLEVHAYWEFSPQELNGEFEWRMVFVTGDGDIVSAKKFPFESDKKYNRIRVQGFPVAATGQVELQVEWRKKKGGKWKRCDAFWPMEIEVKPATAKQKK